MRVVPTALSKVVAQITAGLSRKNRLIQAADGTPGDRFNQFLTLPSSVLLSLCPLLLIAVSAGAFACILA